jgi:alkaline phosphatase D
MHAGGIRAWWEYLPLRAPYDEIAPSPRDRLRLQRSFRFGKLAELFVTDDRLRRDAHPCGERGPGDRIYRMDATCPGRTAPGRTMLGDEQRRWLVDGLAGSAARWKLWATSVPLTPVGYGSGPGRLFLTLDTWTGYEHERRAILGELAQRGVRNLVSLTGDIHTFFAARLHADEADPLRENSLRSASSSAPARSPRPASASSRGRSPTRTSSSRTTRSSPSGTRSRTAMRSSR